MLKKGVQVILIGLFYFLMFSLVALQVKAEEKTIFSDNFDSTIPGDVNGDGIVNILDISHISAHWYPGPPIGPLDYDPNADINKDGAISILEVSIVSANWGRSWYGTFPSGDGWELVRNGAGDQYQLVVDTFSVSPRTSFQLLGTHGWSSVVKNDFTSTSRLIGYEVYVRTEALKGSDYSVAHVGFFNRPIDSGGRYYATVSFEDSGLIRSGGEILQSYRPYTWYKVKVMIDKTTRVYSVWIDDVLKGQSLVEANNPQEILSFELESEWAGVKAYFDDVKVFEESTPPPPPSGVPEFDVSVVFITSILLCAWLLTKSRAIKRRKETNNL